MPQETVDKIVEDFATAVRNVDVPVKEWYQFATEQATKHGTFATAGTGNVYIGKDGLRKIIDDYGVRNIDRQLVMKQTMLFIFQQNLHKDLIQNTYENLLHLNLTIYREQ